MGVSAVTPSAPQFTSDLRPAADAAASLRQSRPVAAMALGPVPPTIPPVPTQAAAVSRLMIGASVIEPGPSAAISRTGTDTTERRLVPFGIYMLPEPAEEDAAPAPQAFPSASRDDPRLAPQDDDPSGPVAGSTGQARAPDARRHDPDAAASPIGADVAGGDDGSADVRPVKDETAA